MTHTAAFAHYGTKPSNIRNSWSAVNEETGTVVVTLWQDEFEGRPPHLVYDHPGYDPNDPDSRPGYAEMMRHLQWALEHCDGLVRTIVAIPEQGPDGKRIGDCTPRDNLLMSIAHLDTAIGAFRLEQVVL